MSSYALYLKLATGRVQLFNVQSHFVETNAEGMIQSITGQRADGRSFSFDNEGKFIVSCSRRELAANCMDDECDSDTTSKTGLCTFHRAEVA